MAILLFIGIALQFCSVLLGAAFTISEEFRKRVKTQIQIIVGLGIFAMGVLLQIIYYGLLYSAGKLY